MSTDDRATLLKDAALGKQVLMFYVMCKTSCFTQLPLLWLGISSFNWREARHHAAVCQRLHALQAPGADHHLSRTLCDTLGEDLNQFIHGQPPSTALLSIMASMRFNPINEQGVEGLHAATKRGTAIAPHVRARPHCPASPLPVHQEAAGDRLSACPPGAGLPVQKSALWHDVCFGI